MDPMPSAAAAPSRSPFDSGAAVLGSASPTTLPTNGAAVFTASAILGAEVVSAFTAGAAALPSAHAPNWPNRPPTGFDRRLPATSPAPVAYGLSRSSSSSFFSCCSTLAPGNIPPTCVVVKLPPGRLPRRAPRVNAVNAPPGSSLYFSTYSLCKRAVSAASSSSPFAFMMSAEAGIPARPYLAGAESLLGAGADGFISKPPNSSSASCSPVLISKPPNSSFCFSSLIGSLPRLVFWTHHVHAFFLCLQ